MEVGMRAIRPKWYQWAIVVALAAAIGGSGVVLAQAQQAPASAGICTRPERFLTTDDRVAIARVIRERVKQKLGLSDQQADQIRGILQSWQSETRADMQALCEARVELGQLLASQGSDPAALKAVAERVKAVQGRLVDRRIETAIALKAQLTDEQWAKWVELRKAMGQRWMGRRGQSRL